MTKLIADACANHCGNPELMDQMVIEAAKAGVDVIKFQSFRAETLSKDWPDYENSFNYYKKHELSPNDHHRLKKLCEDNGIEFLTTVTDLGTVDFLVMLGLDRVKIASSDCNNWPLLEKCLTHFNHLIISTGMHSSEEVHKLEYFLQKHKAMNRVTVMHCVSLYPTPPDKVNFLRYRWLMSMFNSVGFSDHTKNLNASKLAIAFGAAAVERHCTLDRALPGKDQNISSTPKEFAILAKWRKQVEVMMYCPEKFADKESRIYIGRWSNGQKNSWHDQD